MLLTEDFTYVDGSLVGNGAWKSVGGTAGDFLVASNQAVVEHGTPSEDVEIPFTQVTGAVYAGFNFSVDDLGAPYSGTDNEYFAHFDFKARMDVVAPSGSGDFSVGISSGSGSAEVTWATDLTFGTSYRAVLKYDQDTGITQLWINPTTSADTSITTSTASVANVSNFELRQSDSSENETVRVDDLMIGQTFTDVLAFVAATDPELSITGISENEIFSPETTKITAALSIKNFTLSGDNGSGMSDGSGDGYIKTTFTKTGNPAEETSFFTTTPPDIEVEAGASYSLSAELVDNSGNSLTPAISSSISFSVASYNVVADIAALRAGSSGDFYALTGVEVVMTYNAGNSRNQKYIQDATGAILIDDASGVITTSYNVGDGISGLKGKLSSFGGVIQIVPQVDPGAATSTGNTITAQVVTIDELNTNLNNYESEWVTVENVNFAEADGTATFAASTNYNISDGTNTLVFRSAFSGSDFIGSIIPSSSASVTGLAAEYNGTSQLFGTNSANIVLSTSKNEILGFATYPNPITNKRFTISSSNADLKEVSIFNVLGKEVFSTSFSGLNKNIDVSAITSGVYILKVTEAGKTATKKLVVR